MPFKARQFYNRRRKSPKVQPKRDWSDYNKKMKMRGDITIWLSPDLIDQWTIMDRQYDGSGTPLLFTDMAIITVHEIRQVFRLPLRQCEGFVNALFKMMDLDLRSPSFSTLSKRLKTLGLKQPVYRLSHAKGTDIKMIAIDSSGLKCYGQDEWVLEKYGEISEKRNWRKIHMSVDQYNIAIDILFQYLEESIRIIIRNAVKSLPFPDEIINQIAPNLELELADLRKKQGSSYKQLANYTQIIEQTEVLERMLASDLSNELANTLSWSKGMQ